MAKPKIAIYWAASCGGCDVAVLDTNEKLLDIAAIADLVLWPIALDFKYHHIEAMPDKSIDLCLWNGAIRNSEQEKIANLLRAKSKVMVAFGS
jgi:F420-non-reducing hydrogenase small subunit